MRPPIPRPEATAVHTARAHADVIVLDAGQVLVALDTSRIYRSLSALSGRPVDGRMPPALARLLADVEVGARDWRDIPPAINALLGTELDAASWRTLWLSMFTGEIPGMYAALAGLKSRFSLVALSNTCRVHWEYLVARYPLFGLLDGWIVSYEAGLAKPDPAVYRLVMERYCGGKAPAFYVDDMPQFVEAAQRLGWRAQVFTGADALLAAVDAL